MTLQQLAQKAHYVKSCFLILILITFTASCRSRNYPSENISDTPDLEFHQTPSSLNSIGTTIPEVSSSETNEPLKSPIAEFELRVTYVTLDIDEDNEISSTKLWILDPPYRDPELLLALGREDGLSGYINPQWAIGHTMIAYTQLSQDGNSIVSILDANNNEVKDLNFSTISLDEIILLFDHSWSPNNEWFYVLAYNNLGGTTRGALVNIGDGQKMNLDYEMQEEVLSWSPINMDQYLSVLHPKFLELGEEILQIKQIDTATPLLTFSSFDDYSIPFGAKMLWAPDGRNGIIQAIDKNDQPINLWIDFDEASWKSIPESQDLRPSDWSPSGTAVAFEGNDENLHVLQIIDADFSFLKIPATEDANIIGWLADGYTLVYEQNLLVFAVNIREPALAIAVQDFQSPLEGILHYQLQILDR